MSALNVLFVSDAITTETSHTMKAKLKRIVAMLTRLALRSGERGEPAAQYATGLDYEHDYEHE